MEIGGGVPRWLVKLHPTNKKSSFSFIEQATCLSNAVEIVGLSANIPVENPVLSAERAAVLSWALSALAWVLVTPSRAGSRARGGSSSGVCSGV